MKKHHVWPVLLLVVFALSRWPGLMPKDFGAAYAIAFCAGLYLPGRMRWLVPLCVLAGTDLILNVHYSPQGFSIRSFLMNEAPTLLAYVPLVALGIGLGAKRPLWLLVSGGLIGAIIFYIITNTAAWLTDPGYAKTLAGWWQALTIGLPGYPPTWEFFRNTLLSGGLFTGLFVGAMKATEASEEKEKEEETAPQPDAEGEPAGAESDGK